MVGCFEKRRARYRTVHADVAAHIPYEGAPVLSGGGQDIVAATSGDTTLLSVVGEIDTARVADLQAHIDSAFEQGGRFFVFDLERVTFLDSAVLHTLLRAVRRARRAGGDASFVCSAPDTRRLLEVFGLTRDAAVADSTREAFATFEDRMP